VEQEPELCPWRFASNRLVGLTALLLFFGLIMVASTAATGGSRPDVFMTAVLRRLAYMALGTAAFAAGALVNYQWWRRHWVLLSGIGMALLVLVLVPGVGTQVNGARRWIRLGGIMGVQPSEFAKVALVIALAAYCERTAAAKQMGGLLRGFLGPCAVIGMASLLVLAEPDFGTAVLIGMVGMSILLVCGTRLVYVLLAGAAAAPVAYKLVFEVPYRLERITTFLDPWREPMDAGYQLVQSLVAIGSGGLLGKGLGANAMGFLPAASNDFIFSTIAEQFGLVGGVLVIAAFVWLVWEGLQVALRARDQFGFMLAFGVTLLFGMQVVINIAVATGCMPTKGLSLPLVSSGGSSLCICMWAAGILVSVARSIETPERFQLVTWQEDMPRHERTLSRFAAAAEAKLLSALPWGRK